MITSNLSDSRTIICLQEQAFPEFIHPLLPVARLQPGAFYGCAITWRNRFTFSYPSLRLQRTALQCLMLVSNK